MKRSVLNMLCLCFSLMVNAQQKTLNIPGIHQLVAQSKSEHNLQVSARDRQAVVNANEQANLTILSKIKTTYRELQQRYHAIGLAIDLANIGFNAKPMVSRIIGNQSQILELVERNPALLAIGYQAELQFARQANDLISYVAGLTLSMGDINQMKTSDRKILFDFALSELSQIQDLSANMLRMLQYSNLAALLRSANPFQNFIDADIAIGKEIIQNAKYLK